MKGKVVCKAVLQQQLGLSKQASNILVSCFISEVPDVELKNLKAVVRNAIKRGVQFILIGVETESASRTLQFIQEELEDENVQVINRYDEALEHLVFAGSDIILCESFHDPILQVPLKALKYGAAPIAITNNDRFSHFTDNDYEPSKFSQFINSTFGSMSLSQAIDEIVGISNFPLLHKNVSEREPNLLHYLFPKEKDPSKWKQKMMDAMERDFSWNAECYGIHHSAYRSMVDL